MRVLPLRMPFGHASRLFWLSLGALAILAWAWNVVGVFQTPDNIDAPTFGTAWAPYSDALGPWLEGGLSFLFGMDPMADMYRPTVGLFWGSILAAAGRVEMIPIFFTGWVLALLAAALLLSRDYSLRKALTIWLAISVISFAQTWLWLNIATTAVDFAAFALTLSGVVLLIYNPRPSAPLEAPLAGSLCLGVAAAIRGPMMLGGALMILVRVWGISDNRFRSAVLAGLFFVVPIAIDAGLQRHYGVVNNGLMSLFCVYSSPTHSWSPDCNTAFLEKMPTGGEVITGYTRFLFSAAGVRFISDRFPPRVLQDLAVLQQGAAYALMVLAGLLGLVPSKNMEVARQDRAPDGGSLRFSVMSLAVHWSSLLMALAVVGSLLVVKNYRGGDSWPATVWVISWLLVSVSVRNWRSALCFCGYLAGTFFLCLIGLSSAERLQGTFSFTLYLGAALLITEVYGKRNVDAAAPGNARAPLALAILGAVVLLYVGNVAFPSKLRETYLREVYRQPMSAIKLSDDGRIDRSLWYTGERHLIYTHFDPVPVGQTRTFRALAIDSVWANASFVTPNAFLQ